ncbi:hypothetical protein CHO01_37050 [Cellulomonas hominis]|uniref:Uncharacterized protein n=1 Tax=Cellulomonas hominis TaxID=156981 RepID=A0A511FH39_9CELL|nr:hypothetical protein [Cellulomonas hominis]MBB5474709.1 hypothetical protein [Cellulomonas hominis]NKY06788.1 hypothetical protein [Cellulomonas hominis]GEL48589.1 hypothetical protein CHO01_37050 [Cellulomonas hominis]
MTQPRVPAGRRAGGQFSAAAHDESPAELPAPGISWGEPEVKEWSWRGTDTRIETRRAHLDGEQLIRAQRSLNSCDPVRVELVHESNTDRSTEPPTVHASTRLRLRSGDRWAEVADEDALVDRLARVDLDAPWTPPLPKAVRDAIRQVDFRVVEERRDTEEYPTSIETVEVAGTGSEFDTRVRALLGVGTGTVHTRRETSENNLWGCETWETESQVVVSCAGASRTFETVAELFAALEALG